MNGTTTGISAVVELLAISNKYSINIGQRMIKLVLKYHKTDLVADEVRLFFSPRFNTALAGFSFENCAVLQIPMDPD